MKKNVTTVYHVVLCVLVWTVDSSEEDPCRLYSTCSSCTTVRYEARQIHQDLIERYEKNTVGSIGFSGEKKETERNRDGSSRRNLRGPRRSLQDEDFLLRFGRPYDTRMQCSWCPVLNSCQSSFGQNSCGAKSNTTFPANSRLQGSKRAVLRDYECDCPLAPQPYPEDPPSLLPNWMGVFLNETNGAFGAATLLDLSLPGTHDSMTYDLSLTISDDAIDHMVLLDDALHAASGGMVDILPGDLEEFLRLQSKTQQLNIVQQLDNGIRFIDFRIMMDKRSKTWYAVHFMQSTHNAMHYFKEIRQWLDAHPTEIIVVWLSKHGLASAVGEFQYPGVLPEEKQPFWRKYQSIFGDLLIDSRLSRINETSISQLVDRNHRVVTFVSDYKEFTDSSPFALDGANIENPFGISDGVFDEPTTMKTQLEYFVKAPDNNREAKSLSKFTLMAMNTPGPGWQLVAAAINRFVPRLSLLRPLLDKLDSSALVDEIHSCASRTQIPGVQQWCPETLLDIAQLNSYYNQISLEKALEWFLLGAKGGLAPLVSFPNAFYLDALDYDGTIRTGSQLLFGAERHPKTNLHANAKYAYVDTILTFNLHKCLNGAVGFRNSGDSWNQSSSGTLWNELQERRRKHPLTVWDDPELGRHSTWPDVTVEQLVGPASSDEHEPKKNFAHSKPIVDSWWGLVSPHFTFTSIYSTFGSRIRYLFAKLGSGLLRFIQG